MPPKSPRRTRHRTKSAGDDAAEDAPQVDQLVPSSLATEDPYEETEALVPRDEPQRDLPPAEAPEGQVLAKTISPSTSPFSELLREALVDGNEQVLRLQRGPSPFVDAKKVSVASSLYIEAEPGSLLPPVLRLPGLVVAGEGTHLILKHLYLEAGSATEALLDIRTGASVELVDCRLEGGGIRLCPGASAKLVRSRVSGAQGPGIAGAEFSELVLVESKVTGCSGCGVHSTSGRRLCLSDCTVTDNELSGLLVDGRPCEDASCSGCTISRNGQFGVWADSNARIAWTRNSLAGNLLGERGGRGLLEGWQLGATFSVGDACLAWMEKKTAWVPGVVKSVAPAALVVTAQVPSKAEAGMPCLPAQSTKSPLRRARRKTQEAPTESINQVQLVLSHGEVCLPRSGECRAPSSSKKVRAFQRKSSALELFLREGGNTKEDWEALESRDRSRFQARARKEQKEKQEAGSAGRQRRERAMAKSGLIRSGAAGRKRGRNQADLLLSLGGGHARRTT